MERNKYYLTNKSFLLSFLGGALLLVISLIVQYYTSGYVTRSISEPVTDIVLSNTRVWDVGAIFIWGAILLATITAFFGLKKINNAPFIMKSIGTFTLIRSFFVSLTHISPFPTRAIIESTFFQHPLFNGIFTGNDLFFSGHTGIPFLFALIFWENKILRLVFLGFSIVFAVVVLLGHFRIFGSLKICRCSTI